MMLLGTGHRARIHPWPWAVALLVALGVVCSDRVATAQADPEPDPSDPPASTEAAAQAFDPAGVLAAADDQDARREAARGVLQRLAADTTLALPHAWLSEDPAESLRLLSELAAGPDETEALVAAIVRAARRGNGSDGSVDPAPAAMSADARAACLALLSRSNDPGAAEVLVRWLEELPAGQRRPVVEALVGLTGRHDLGESPEAWRQWLTRHRHLPPASWRGVLAGGLRERTLHLTQRERDLLRALVDSSRRLYAALPAEDRPAALTRMLADPEPAIRLTATDLLLRDLERGVSPAPEVSAAVVQLLDDPQASIRQAAAVLVDRIVPEGSAARLSVALRRETDPDVAAVMLRAFRRSPDATAIDALLRWLEHGEPTHVAAMRAVLAILESGFEPAPPQRDRILAQIDAQQTDSLTPAGVRVLARLGGPAGLDRVRALLFAPRAEIRRAAADALVDRAASVDDLLLAADADPDLLRRAADAVASHKPWANSLRRVAILELHEPTDAQAAEPLPVTASLARLLPMPERLAAAQTLVGRPMAIRAVLGVPTRDMFADGPAGDRDFNRARSLLGLPERETEPPETPADTEPAAGQTEPPPG